jgi:phage I-like protein
VEPTPTREPPAEFCVFKFGKIRTTKGEFNFTPEACDMLIAERAEHDADLQIDYDHLAVASAKPADGKAAGWIGRLEKRDDGLWACDVKWTPAAAEMLRSGEYRYFSPYFGATKDTKTICLLMNVAITNLPAMQDIQALVAASRLDVHRADVDGVACVIKHEGDKWNLYDSEGKKLLGSHESKKDAEKQESAINISKARKAGHRIPQQSRQEMTHMAEEHGEMIKLKDFLAKHMKSSGMSMKALAEKVGLPEDKMRALHDGESPTAEEMKAIRKGLSLKGDEIEEDVDARRASQMDNTDPEDTDSEEDKKDQQRVASSRNSARSRRGGEDDPMFLDLVELTGTSDRSKHREVLRNVFAAAAAAPQMKKQLDAITAKSEAQRRSALEEQGKREGKLTPSTLRFWATKSVAEFEEFLRVAPVLPTASLNLQEGTPSAVAHILTPEEIEVCRLTRFSAESLSKHKIEMGNGKAEQAIVDSYYADPA